MSRLCVCNDLELQYPEGATVTETQRRWGRWSHVVSM
jgi:hypothetical protein